MQTIVVWTLLLGAVGLFWYVRRPTVRPAEARKLIAEGALLVDVRSPREFAAGHIDGARNLPVGELKTHLTELGPHEQTIIVYCASGTRSAAAASMLRHAGFQRVLNLGAMDNW